MMVSLEWLDKGGRDEWDVGGEKDGRRPVEGVRNRACAFPTPQIFERNVKV
jgi:hypothetical protein